MPPDIQDMLYWQRRYSAYRLHSNVDWTNPEVQRAWQFWGKHIERFLSVEQPLTRDALMGLCQAYARQHGDPDEKLFHHYSLDHALLELFEMGIVEVVSWWPIT